MSVTSVSELKQYHENALRSARFRTFAVESVALIMFVLLGYFGEIQVLYGIALLVVGAIELFHRLHNKKTYKRLSIFSTVFPPAWRQVLEKHVLFYNNLTSSKKELFEKRVQIFLSEKRVEGIDTEIDYEIRLLVAASGIIPTFAFPAFDYPQLHEVLIYPASFSKKFEINGANKSEENIEGMVGNQYMNHSLLLSKPALLQGFNGRSGEENVGIHEFVHLLDREDGDTDGVPERLLDHAYTLPWLHLIKEETDRIRRGKSDINPYAITNNAEFLAVVSEYFFSDPEEFQEKHPELYGFLSGFYDQNPTV